jgi:hypothetical protein
VRFNETLKGTIVRNFHLGRKTTPGQLFLGQMVGNALAAKPVPGATGVRACAVDLVFLLAGAFLL